MNNAISTEDWTPSPSSGASINHALHLAPFLGGLPLRNIDPDAPVEELLAQAANIMEAIKTKLSQWQVRASALRYAAPPVDHRQDRFTSRVKLLGVR